MVAVNQAGAALVGEPPARMLGRRLTELLQEADRRAAEATLAPVQARERARREAAVLCANSRTVIWDGLLNPVRDSDTVIRHCIGLFIDVTQRKPAEKERENLIIEL